MIKNKNVEVQKTNEAHRFEFGLGVKLNLKSSEKYIALSNLSIFFMSRNIKKNTDTVILKYLRLHGILAWITWRIIFWWIIFSYRHSRHLNILWKHRTLLTTCLIQTHINIIKDRIIFKIESEYAESHGLLSFSRKCGDEYSKKLINTATEAGNDAPKTPLKRYQQKQMK